MTRSARRLTAVFALLGILLGLMGPLQAAAAVAATVGTSDASERWCFRTDEVQPVRLSVETPLHGEKCLAAPQPVALAQAATERMQPRAGQRAARPAPADPPPDPPAHRRPDPTGPPLLG
jgi:hypothetical protein